MKIGIITLIGDNYGNRLQNYAVQELLRQYGEVYTVPYEKKQPSPSNLSRLEKANPFYIKKVVDSRLMNIYHLSDYRMSTLAKGIYFIKHRKKIKTSFSKRAASFRAFEEKYISYETEKLHLSGDDKESWVLSYDAWVCGSDQIWNPTYPTATRNAFLQFAPKQRRIALSASIGLADAKDMLPEYSEWIQEITYLSVRENTAAEIVWQLTGRTAEVFLDPTMILPRDKWDEMADETNNVLPKKFALIYFLGGKERKYSDYIEQSIQNKGLERVDILSGEYTQYLDLAPDQFVDAVRKADVVYADSFHGVVFSILYHKQFVVFERSEEGKSLNSRLETLLHIFGLEGRVYRGNNVKELEQLIDYSNVDQILTKERERVHNFLDKAMMEICMLPKQEEDGAKHIVISRPEECCGCTACSQVCPQYCITMEYDKEGFIYPIIDEQTCIGCGKCKMVCPVLNHDGGRTPIKVLAQKNKNEKVRSTSSSGGVFYEVAKQFILERGIVYGCALDENMVAKHMKVDTLEGLESLKSSKYVQSDMGAIMSEVKANLQAGNRVLFSGTPCQTAGLRNYLGRDYENLFLIDVLCHGVPSPKLFADYLKVLSDKYGGVPVSVNFRNKQRGWKRLYMEVRFNNGKRYFIYSGYDRYESLFLNNMSLRPSCYECKFAKAERYGDITLGDFWGIGKKYPVWDDDKGISVVMLNTEKGMQIYHKVSGQFEGREESLDLAKAGQRTLYAPTLKNPNRDSFYKIFSEEGTVAALETYTKVPSLVTRAYYAVMRWGLDIVRKFMKRGY